MLERVVSFDLRNKIATDGESGYASDSDAEDTDANDADANDANDAYAYAKRWFRKCRSLVSGRMTSEDLQVVSQGTLVATRFISIRVHRSQLCRARTRSLTQ